MTGIAPWLSVADASASLAFHHEAFGAVELERLEADDGTVEVALLSIEGAEVWLQRADPLPPGSAVERPIRLVLTVDDPDEVQNRALAAGASEVSPVGEGNGWRVGRIVDLDGHQSEIGRRIGD
jgi:PhnB protein